MFKGVSGWLAEGQTHTLNLFEAIERNKSDKMTTDIRRHTHRGSQHTHNCRAKTSVGIKKVRSRARRSINSETHSAHSDCQSLKWDHLPEPLSIGDEQIGVWWVTMAARHLHRTGTISGT